VNNGGFYQYFWNRTGALAPYVVDALKAIGAVGTAGIAQQALALVGREISWSDDAARKAHIDELSSQAKQKLHDLDQGFYAYPDDLTKLLYAADIEANSAPRLTFRFFRFFTLAQ
jgi:hypothetical protein